VKGNTLFGLFITIFKDHKRILDCDFFGNLLSVMALETERLMGIELQNIVLLSSAVMKIMLV
jgi:hypothetical protein